MSKDRKAALAAMGAGTLALFFPGAAKTHHRDTSQNTRLTAQNTRLTALEKAVADLKQRVAALETGTTPTTARYQLTGVTTDRSLNADLYTGDELADVVATLITDLGLKALT